MVVCFSFIGAKWISSSYYIFTCMFVPLLLLTTLYLIGFQSMLPYFKWNLLGFMPIQITCTRFMFPFSLKFWWALQNHHIHPYLPFLSSKNIFSVSVTTTQFSSQASEVSIQLGKFSSSLFPTKYRKFFVHVILYYSTTHSFVFCSGLCILMCYHTKTQFSSKSSMNILIIVLVCQHPAC